MLAVVLPGVLLLFYLINNQVIPGSSTIPLLEERGAILLKCFPGGRSGFLCYSRNTLGLELYQRGIYIKPSIGRPSWLPKNEISQIRKHSAVLTQGTSILYKGNEIFLWTTPKEYKILHNWFITEEGSKGSGLDNRHFMLYSFNHGTSPERRLSRRMASHYESQSQP